MLIGMRRVLFADELCYYYIAYGLATLAGLILRPRYGHRLIGWMATASLYDTR